MLSPSLCGVLVGAKVLCLIRERGSSLNPQEITVHYRREGRNMFDLR